LCVLLGHYTILYILSVFYLLSVIADFNYSKNNCFKFIIHLYTFFLKMSSFSITSSTINIISGIESTSIMLYMLMFHICIYKLSLFPPTIITRLGNRPNELLIILLIFWQKSVIYVRFVTSSCFTFVNLCADWFIHILAKVAAKNFS
ncbi:hypothetical protein L9F63_017532, partial [Diploptera punctata]